MSEFRVRARYSQHAPHEGVPVLARRAARGLLRVSRPARRRAAPLRPAAQSRA